MCRKSWCPSGHHCPEGLTCMLVFAIFSAVLGMFQFGYNTGVINAPQKILENFIADVYRARTGKFMTESMVSLVWSVTVSIFAIGGMVGGISGGVIADYCGRKCGLLLNNAIAILGATLMSSSHLFRSIECLIMGRFFIGLSCGLNTALVPMYLSEIAPMTLRGALGTVSQLGVTIGLLLSQILGLPLILGTDEGWPFLLGVAFIPAVLQLLLLPLCPESPRYLLISKGRAMEATYALQRLRCSTNVEDDIEEMRIEDRAQKEEARITMTELIRNRSLQRPLVIGIVMQLSQQLSGINAIFYYSTDIFTNAGLTEDVAKYSTIGVGVVMVAMSLVSIMLMDRTGRRTLHLYGLGGMFIASMFLSIVLLFRFLYKWMAYMSVFSTLIYVVFFGIGPGSIPWMITAELFSQGPRPAAMSIAVLVNWFTNFIVGLTFPLMVKFNEKAMESYAFLPFTVFLAIFWTFTYFKVPETKNRTFEEITALFHSKDPDQIPIDEYQTSHKSSSGDIYSHKSSSGDVIFNEDRQQATMDKCYLHNHHHHHFSHYGNQQQQQQPQQVPLPPPPLQPGSTHPSPGHPLVHHQQQQQPNGGHQSGIIRPMTPQSQPSSQLPPPLQSPQSVPQQQQQLYHPESHQVPQSQQHNQIPPQPMGSAHHHPHPHPHPHPQQQQQMGNHLIGNHHHHQGTPLMNSLNHHHPLKFEYFTGNLPPSLHIQQQQQQQQQHILQQTQHHSQSQTALNHLTCTTPTSVTPPSSSSIQAAFASSTLGRKKVTLSAAAVIDQQQFFSASTANFTPNHRIIIEDQL